jgi:hypothetical protein
MCLYICCTHQSIKSATNEIPLDKKIQHKDYYHNNHLDSSITKVDTAVVERIVYNVNNTLSFYRFYNCFRHTSYIRKYDRFGNFIESEGKVDFMVFDNDTGDFLTTTSIIKDTIILCVLAPTLPILKTSVTISSGLKEDFKDTIAKHSTTINCLYTLVYTTDDIKDYGKYYGDANPKTGNSPFSGNMSYKLGTRVIFVDEKGKMEKNIVYLRRFAALTLYHLKHPDDSINFNARLKHA